MCSLIKKLHNELDESQLLTESDCSDEVGVSKEPPQQTFMVAKQIQMEMKTKAKEHSANVFNIPGETIEISYKSAEQFIPNILYKFVPWMVTKTEFTVSEDTDRVTLPVKEHEKVLTIA